MMKRLLSIAVLTTMLLGTGGAYADVKAEPVLISAPQPVDVVTPITEAIELSGFIISYENNTLVMKERSLDTTVTIYDKKGSFASVLGSLKEKDFIEVSALPVEDDYLLMDVIGYSPRVDVGAEKPAASSDGIEIFYGDHKVTAEMKPQDVDGALMVPLASTLRAMGYTVTWNHETKSVEILRGAQWTQVTIGENQYAKNKMATHPLSQAPVIIDGLTLVPAEFFTVILDQKLKVESGNLMFSDSPTEVPVIHNGFVQEIAYDETGAKIITLSLIEGSDASEDLVILYTSSAYTYEQREIAVGDRITALGSDAMTASLPPQTTAYLIY